MMPPGEANLLVCRSGRHRLFVSISFTIEDTPGRNEIELPKENIELLKKYIELPVRV